jgi:hypothetical protein
MDYRDISNPRGILEIAFEVSKSSVAFKLELSMVSLLLVKEKRSTILSQMIGTTCLVKPNNVTIEAELEEIRSRIMTGTFDLHVKPMLVCRWCMVVFVRI